MRRRNTVLNGPAMTLCFWCRQPTGIALPKRWDVSKPTTMETRYIMTDYEPCDKCLAQFKQGVFCFEAEMEPIGDSDPKVYFGTSDKGDKLYPNGQFLVIRAEAARELFNNPNLSEGDKICLEPGLVQKITDMVKRPRR